MAAKDLETRVSALEHEVRKLASQVQASQQDSAAARILAGGADREVGELQAELRDFRQAATASLNALRADALDLRAQVDAGFARFDDAFGRVGEAFGRVDQGFLEIRARLDATAAGQQQIAEMLQSLIDKS